MGDLQYKAKPSHGPHFSSSTSSSCPFPLSFPHYCSLPFPIPTPIPNALLHHTKQTCSALCTATKRYRLPPAPRNWRYGLNVTETSATRCFWLVILGTGHGTLLCRLGRAMRGNSQGYGGPALPGDVHHQRKGPGSAVQAGGLLSTGQCCRMGHQGDRLTEGTRSLLLRWRVVGLQKCCGESQGALQHLGEGCWGWGAWATSGRCLLGKRGAEYEEMWWPLCRRLGRWSRISISTKIT